MSPIDPHTDQYHDDANWDGFFRQYAPNERARTLRGDLQNILSHLPPTLEAECAIPIPSQMPHMDFVALTPERGEPRYARVSLTPLIFKFLMFFVTANPTSKRARLFRM